MQPTVLNSHEHFHNLMAMRIFREACEQWCVENKNFQYDVTIKVMYFDAGQDWKYTGFLTTDTNQSENSILSSWQSLNPRDWSLVVECMDIPKIIDMAWYYMDNLANGKDIKLYEKFE